MSPLTEPTNIILRNGWQPMDPDAAAYITAVETADGQVLEEKVKIAIDNFVLGCKADGIWSAIKASCILAGARTLNGALVPLVGTAPTNFNFVASDYNRKTGLVGDGSTKYLDTNQTVSSNPVNNKHLAVFTGQLFSPAQSATLLGGFDTNGDHIDFGLSGSIFNIRLSSSVAVNPSLSNATGLYGITRADATNVTYRQANVSTTVPIAENQTITTIPILAFSMGQFGGRFYSGRLSFYSIGESLDLALLDARVTDLINKFAEVIP